jgi:hypothetical protein
MILPIDAVMWRSFLSTGKWTGFVMLSKISLMVESR